MVTKQVELIFCLFTTSPGRGAVRLLEESKLRLTHPSLASIGAESGNKSFAGQADKPDLDMGGKRPAKLVGFISFLHVYE